MIKLLLLLALIVPIQVIHVDGYQAIKPIHTKRLIRQAEKHFKPLNIHFALKPQINIAQDEPYLSPVLLAWRFYWWNSWASRAGLTSRNEIKLFIVPPFLIRPSTVYIGGASASTCTYKSAINPVAMAAAEYKNANGVSRWRHSVIVVAHELGHALGASHTKANTIMNGNILPYIDGLPRLAFAPESLAQMRTCLRGK